MVHQISQAKLQECLAITTHGVSRLHKASSVTLLGTVFETCAGLHVSGNGFPPSCHMCSEMKTPEPNLFVSGLRPSHTKKKSKLQSRRWAPVQLPGQRKVTLVMSTNSKNRCHWFRCDCLPCRSEPFLFSIRVCLTSWA